MKIAVIGGGLTGLAAAYELGKHGHAVSVFEKEQVPGGLAQGYREKGWDWALEKAYHHLFTNDSAIISLIDELGIGNNLLVKRPITATYWNGKAYPMDTPMNFLQFPGIPLTDRIRTGMMLAAIKLFPYRQTLGKTTSEIFLRKYGGSTAWRTLWQPLMEGKFDRYAPAVAASWFWARIKKRTPKLLYITGGFETLINRLVSAIIHQGGIIRTKTEIPIIISGGGSPRAAYVIHSSPFDRILLTVPTPVVAKLVPTIGTFLKSALSIPHLHAQTLVLETIKPILNNIYWLNITDRSFPFLAVVAHTNFMDKARYAGNHVTYFGNYLPEGHPYLSLTKDQLYKKFLPFIRRLNPSFNPQLSTVNYQLYTGLYAQPVHGVNYRSKVPKLTTPLPGVYIANMDSVFPWDRGTNYAVELGLIAAGAIHDGA